MAHALPDHLVTYLSKRNEQRAAAVESFLADLSDYERGLIHDAAVMGYVRGSMHPRGEDIPLDKAIIADVVSACFVHRDLYSYVNAEFDEHRTTVEYYAQTQQPDGTWVDSTSRTEDPEAALHLLDGVRERVPDAKHRLAQRTTSVRVRTASAQNDDPASTDH